MRLLVVGCGSIGQRHARNAAGLAAEVGVVDADPGRAAAVSAEIGVRSFTNLEAALAWKPDGAVIATPNHLHIEHARAALAAGAHVLIEKPVSHQVAGVADFLRDAERAGRSVFVGCNMRYHPGPTALRRALQHIGLPLFARAQFGNHLPSMRPGVDYRTLYCARHETGGGVILDSIHEIDYVSWLLGPITSVACSASRISTLEIKAEDYAAITTCHDSGARAEIHLDYIQRFKRRGCELVGSDGTLIWASEGKVPEHCSVRLYRAEISSWETLYHSEDVDANAMYVAMLAEFLSVLEGAAPDNLLDGWAALSSLAAAHAALLAAESGRAQTVEWLV